MVVAYQWGYRVAMIAAAFYPKDVIVRLSDFKSSEYAGLLGGRGFEPEEGNPMLGFRGAFRYAHPRYREAFGLECRALRGIERGVVIAHHQPTRRRRWHRTLRRPKPCRAIHRRQPRSPRRRWRASG